MTELIYFSELFDIYSSLLTGKQRQTFEDYYFENLTFEEIAENNNISKNAVSKTLKSCKTSLEAYERALHLRKKKILIEKEFQNEQEILKRINKYDNIK